GVPTSKILESEFTGIPGQFTVQQSFDKPSFTGGPAFGAVLYDRVVVQFDALYKPVRIFSNTRTPVANIVATTRGGSWEFPLVFDYRFFRGTVRPYAGGGMVLGQILSGTTESRSTFLSTGIESHTYNQFQTFTNQFPAYVANAGVEWNTSRIVIRPELRYTRWDETRSSPKRQLDQFGLL